MRNGVQLENFNPNVTRTPTKNQKRTFFASRLNLSNRKHFLESAIFEPELILFGQKGARYTSVSGSSALNTYPRAFLACCRCGDGTDVYTVYPWIHQKSNNRSNDDQTRPVTFPDINPMELSETTNPNFSMAAGDFLDVYTEPGTFVTFSNQERNLQPRIVWRQSPGLPLCERKWQGRHQKIENIIFFPFCSLWKNQGKKTSDECFVKEWRAKAVSTLQENSELLVFLVKEQNMDVGWLFLGYVPWIFCCAFSIVAVNKPKLELILKKRNLWKMGNIFGICTKILPAR